MRYLFSLLIRYVLAFCILVSSNLFLFVFFPLTFYTVRFLTSLFTSVLSQPPFLTLHGVTFEFVDACVAVLAYILLAVLFLLTKDLSLSDGLFLFFYGSFMIFILNILRIELLIFLLVSSNDTYGIAHYTKALRA